MSKWYKRQRDKLKQTMPSHGIQRSLITPYQSSKATQSESSGSRSTVIQTIEDTGDSPVSLDSSLVPSGKNPSPIQPSPTASVTTDTNSSSAFELERDGESPNREMEEKGEWEALKGLLGVLQSSPEPCVALKSAIGGLNLLGVDIYRLALRKQEGYQELWDKIDDRLRDLVELGDGLLGPAMTPSVNKVFHQIIAQLKVAKIKLEKYTFGENVDAMDDSDETLRHVQQIYDDVERLVLNANLKMWETTDEEATAAQLCRLSLRRPGFCYSWSSDSTRMCVCAQGTRLTELRELRNWALNPTNGSTYWINGMTGTGKTTIAYSLCSKLNATGHLAASVFCTRLIPEYCAVQNIIPSIAYQLAQFSYPFRHALAKVLDPNRDVHTWELDTQFHRLIVTPIREVRHTLPFGLIVVLDALDECNDGGRIETLLDLLVTSASQLPLRFLISSRPEPYISRALKMQSEGKPGTQMILHKLDPLHIERDIETYLRHELREVPLAPNQWKGLIKRCGTLFQYASTASRHIKSRRGIQGYEDIMDAVHKLSSLWPKDDQKGLDELYTSILEAAFKHHGLSELQKNLMKTILDAVACVEEPMTTEILAGLLELEDTAQTNALLQPLCSVIQVMDNGTVVPVHVSFRNFMLNPDRSSSFHSDLTTYHNTLANACLRHIRSNPVRHKNTKRLSPLFLLDLQMAEIASQDRFTISPSLLYACRHWIMHLDLGGQPMDVVRSINETYNIILEAAFSELATNGNQSKNMKAILDTVICAQGPMTTETLSSILGFKDEKQLSALLLPLRPVIRIMDKTGVVEPRHATFRDFMVDGDRSGKFHCDAATHHSFLTQACLLRIKCHEKQFNVCDLETSYLADDSVPMLIERAVDMIPSSLLYACRHWATHLGLGARSIELLELMHDFLSERLLLWMEVVNTTKGMGAGVDIIQRAKTWCETADAPTEVVELIYDAWEFVSVYANHPVSLSTPHIYISMLPFWPVQRPISKIYAARIAGMPQRGGTTSGKLQPSLQIAWNMGEKVKAVCPSTDGARLVAAVGNNLYLLDRWTGQTILGPMGGHTDQINSIAFSPNGLHVASGSSDGTVRVWDTKNGRSTVGSLQVGPSRVMSVAFSPAGTQIVSAGENGGIQIWSVESGEHITGALEGDTSAARCAAFSAEGSIIIVGDYQSSILFWDVHSAKPDGTPITGHSASILSLALSSDGSRFATASLDSTIHIWDSKTRQALIGPLKGHVGGTNQVVFSPKGQYIATCGDDSSFAIWEAGTGGMITDSFEGHAGAVNSVMFLPDGSHLVTCSDDGTIRVWHVQGLDENNGSTEGSASQIRVAHVSSDGSRIVTGAKDGNIYVWDSRSGELVIGPLTGHTGEIYSLDISPDSSYIASTSSDKTVRLWGIKCGSRDRKVLKGCTTRPESVKFSPDSTRLVFGPDSPEEQVWDVKTGQLIVDTPRKNHGHIYLSRLMANAHRLLKPDIKHIPATLIDALRGYFQSPPLSKFALDFQTSTKYSRLPFRPITDCFTTVQAVRNSPSGSRLVFGPIPLNMQVENLRVEDLQGRIPEECFGSSTSSPLNGAKKGHAGPILSIFFLPDGTSLLSCFTKVTPHTQAVPRKLKPANSSPSGSRQGTSITKSTTAITDQNWKLNPDGWVVNSQGELLIWVPSELHASFVCGENRTPIYHTEPTKLDLNSTNTGKSWTKWYRPCVEGGQTNTSLVENTQKNDIGANDSQYGSEEQVPGGNMYAPLSARQALQNVSMHDTAARARALIRVHNDPTEGRHVNIQTVPSIYRSGRWARIETFL